MDQTNVRGLVTKANSAFNTSERSNFRTLWQTASSLCRPSGNTVLGVRSPGEKKPVDRLIDIGVNSLNVFTSGVTSTLTPKGSRFFEYSVSKRSRDTVSNALQRWFVDVSKIALDFVNETNFFNEASKAFSDLGLIGTALLLTEPDAEEGLRFKSYYIDQFAFMEDAKGRVDTVFMKIDMTARQMAQKFGADALTTKQEQSIGKGVEQTFTVIHAILPREDYEIGTLNPIKKRFASFFIEESEAKVLLESGFDAMPAAVCRWAQASNEIYGRSPATETVGNLSMINAMEYTKLRSAQRRASPQWLCPDDGSVRNLNNQDGGIVYWNASNVNAKPEQIVSKDAPELTDAYIMQKNKEIEDAFFVPVWNPLNGMGKSATATEVQNRVSLAKQNLVPKISRVTDELLTPTFKRIFQILFDGGHFPQAPDDFDIKKIKVTFTSTSGLILKQIENAATLQFVETVGFLAQSDPSALDYIDIDEVVKNTAESAAVPTDVIRSDSEVKRIRAARAEQQKQQVQAQNQQALAQAYSQTTSAPEPGSPAELLQSLG